VNDVPGGGPGDGPSDRPGRIGYLSLGSNVGDRRAHLAAAVEALPRHGVSVLASSSTYDTEPVGLVLDQPTFLNACLRVRTALRPEELLDACKRVERAVGREAGGVRHGPRVIDVDVLLLGDLSYSSERLTLPHAEVLSRRFVLVPLLELDPHLSIPPAATRLADALAGLGPGQEVRLVGPPLAPRGLATQ
jgi:2-amino-4-hydroxy-6-hydroxymethyldihydropteridine diphosphokinase